jgi:Tol biopolymer transport system component
LVFHDSAAVYAINPDGTDRTMLFAISPSGVSYNRWSPDHTRIASSTMQAIVIRGRDGAIERTLDSGGRLAWSHDGARLVYECGPGGSLCIVDVDGGAPKKVSVGDCVAQDPDWSPDASRLVFRCLKPDGSESIAIVDIATETVTDIVTTATGPGIVEVVSQPRWSSTDDVIAYSFKPRDDVKYELWLVRPDGSGAHAIVTDPRGDSPAWSPDDSRIAFAPQHFDNDPGPLIWIVAADGADGAPVPGLAYDPELTFEQQLVFDDW